MGNRASAPPRLTSLLALFFLLCSCEKEIEVRFQSEISSLAIGQRASLVVTQGGAGSALDKSTFRLQTADKQVFDSTSSLLELETVETNRVDFSVPPGVAAGPAALSIATFKGKEYSITGTVEILRLIAVRDLAGKLWLLALKGDGTVSEYLDYQPGVFGQGSGKIAVGHNGRMLATVAQEQLYIVGLSGDTGGGISLLVRDTNDIVVTPSGVALLATDTGIQSYEVTSGVVVKKEDLPIGNTLALALDRTGTRGAAIVEKTPQSFSIALLLLAEGTLKALGTQLDLPDVGLSADDLAMAMNADGKLIAVINGATDQVAVLEEGNAGLFQCSFPSSEQGPVSIASDRNGPVFYVLNKTSMNVSIVTLGPGNGSCSFGIPIVLPMDAGAPLQIVVSNAGDVVILFEHGLYLVEGGRAKKMTFENLFSGGVGGNSMAIQP